MIPTKKAISAGVLITLIIVLVSFVAVSGLYAKVIGTGESIADRLCSTSALANAFGKTPIIGTQTFQLECPRKLTTISFKGEGRGFELETKVRLGDDEKTSKKTYKSYDLAGDRIEKFNFEEVDEDIFVLNHAIADQIKKCWDNLGKGQLNLFSEWWSPLGLDEAQADANWFKQVGSKIPRYKGAPVNCVICSRIKFDEATVNAIKSKNPGLILSLEEWLRKNPIPRTKPPISYFEYLLDDVHVGLFEGQNFVYDVNEPYAVVFTRINVLKSTEFLRDIVDIFPGYSEKDHPDAVDAIYLKPFNKLGDECTLIFN